MFHSRFFLLVFLVTISTATIPSFISPLLYTVPFKDLTFEGGSFENVPNACKSANCSFYIRKNIIGTKIANHLNTVVLLTPRYKPGTPCTISTYDKKKGLTEPVFSPFPSLKDHELGNCRAIQNAIDFYLDKKGFLWVLDIGRVNDLESPEEMCKPKVVQISMHAKKIVKTYDLSKFVKYGHELHDIIADYDSKGKVHLYITDSASNSILIYNIHDRSAHRISLDHVFKTSKSEDTLNILLTKPRKGPSELYISSSTSPDLYSIKTSYLKGETSHGRITTVGAKGGPIVFLGTNDKDLIYFRYNHESKIYRWKAGGKFCHEELEPIYKSEGGFSPTSVSYDSMRNSMSLIESNLEDYLEGKCGVGAFQRINEFCKFSKY